MMQAPQNKFSYIGVTSLTDTKKRRYYTHEDHCVTLSVDLTNQPGIRMFVFEYDDSTVLMFSSVLPRHHAEQIIGREIAPFLPYVNVEDFHAGSTVYNNYEAMHDYINDSNIDCLSVPRYDMTLRDECDFNINVLNWGW